MTAKHAVSHYPPRDWPCWTRQGYDAAGQSNLYEGTSRESNSDKIEAYLDDWGGGNHRVGHRRWFLYPYLAAVGIAGTSRANVTHLFGTPFDAAARQPAVGVVADGRLVPVPPRPARALVARLRRGRHRLLPGARRGHPRGRARPRHPAPHPRQRRRQADPGLGDAGRAWPREPVGKAEVTVSDIVVDGVPGQVATYTVRFFRSR